MSNENKNLKRVEILHPFLGICHMGVCTVPDATDDEILDVCNTENPSGTTAGWAEVVRNHENEKMRPIACADHPNRMHYLVSC